MTSTGQTETPSTTLAPRTAFPLHKRVLTALAAVSILGAAGCAGAEAESPASGSPAAEAPTGATTTAPTSTEEPATAAPSGSAAANDPAPTAAAASDQTYTDGTYTQTGSYQSPAGPEEVGVTITLEADVVTAVEVEPMPDNPTTTMYQERFAGGISDAIVGKKLDELAVDKVAGSSLTSGGFNEATGKIKSEAQI
ncbi:FMN-binding protein [Arthrobacter sp. B1805]|uniref:FMN-binding protein n=1 Tax=Arthrobacter sp. B1805 TaxID=2058892 RepID=UPI0021586F53|nr:FMN-binding protein [Arthrobacter sp. B1805]